MAQADYNLADQSGAAFRSELNSTLAAIISLNSGSTAPTTTAAYSLWADTTTGLLKQRNAANNAFVTIGTLGTANLGLAPTANPTFTGVPTCPNAASGTNTTQIANTAFVTDGLSDRNRITRDAGIATTSGTSHTFTGIPAYAKRITMMLLAVSTNGTSGVQIQLGDSGGIETTGYSTSGTAITGTNACGISTFTSGFVMLGTTAGASRSGSIVFTNITGNYWIGTGIVDEQGTAQAGTIQGFKELTGVLDRIRITTITGADAFDAGFVNILYEG